MLRSSLSKAIIPLIFIGWLVPQAAHAQYFGKNKVQYDRYEWSVLETDNFHVYFYSEEQESARDAARMAERAYTKLAKLLDHEVREPIPLLIYASHTDFQQTNALSGLISEGTGGVTEFFKRRVVLPFTGSYGEFDHVLTHELVHAFQLDILLGPDKRAIGAGMTATPPLWFMEGMAEFLSIGEVDEHTKMWLRDAALEGYLVSIPELSYAGDIRVYRFGQSIMDFIAERYGLQKVGELLKNFAKRGSVERAVQATVGIGLEDLSTQWTEAVRKDHLPQIAEFETPEDYGYRLTFQGRDLSRLNLAPTVSPDGDLMAFISDRSLYNDVYLASALDGKLMGRLVEGERNADLESLRFLNAAMSWSPDQSLLAFAAKIGGEDAIYVLRVEDTKVVKRLTFGFDGIQSPSFSPDGQKLVFVGLEAGRSDLFITDFEGEQLERLTHDRYMDRDPHWSPDGKSIAFTTDRGPGTNFKTLDFDEFRIAVFDLDTHQIRVLPFQRGKNINPQWGPNSQNIAFLSDRTGITNVFMTDLETNESFQLTNLLTGVTGITEASPAMSWSMNGDRMVFSVFNRGGWDVYAVKDPLDLMLEQIEDQEFEEESDELAATEDAMSWPRFGGPDDLREERAGLPPGDAAVPGDLGDTLAAGAGAADGDQAGDDSAAAAGGEASEVVTSPALAQLRDDEAPGQRGGRDAVEDEEDEYDDEFVEEEQLDVNYRPPAPDDASFRVRDYKINFSPDNLVAAGAIAPGIGAAGQFALGLSDVLGNHHIQFVANVFGDIRDSDVFLTYMNLERRTNWGVSLFQFRNDYLSFRENAILRIDRETWRGAEFFVSRPFSKFRRVDVSMQLVGIDRVSDGNLPTDGSSSSLGIDFAGRRFFLRPEIAHVTDNVLFGITGPISGARTRASFAKSYGDLTFNTMLLDLRKYINIRQRYVFAFRAMGLSSFGPDAQTFRVGGPYTIRGYAFEEFAGHNIGIINAEFRFPMIEYLAFGWPLPLTFRSIGGVIFFDSGTAFDRHDEFRPFDTTGTTLFRTDDIRASYGLGARVNLGFLIVRWDWAQRTDLSRNLGRSVSTFAIGADF